MWNHIEISNDKKKESDLGRINKFLLRVCFSFKMQKVYTNMLNSRPLLRDSLFTVTYQPYLIALKELLNHTTFLEVFTVGVNTIRIWISQIKADIQSLWWQPAQTNMVVILYHSLLTWNICKKFYQQQFYTKKEPTNECNVFETLRQQSDE